MMNEVGFGKLGGNHPWLSARMDSLSAALNVRAHEGLDRAALCDQLILPDAAVSAGTTFATILPRLDTRTSSPEPTQRSIFE